MEARTPTVGFDQKHERDLWLTHVLGPRLDLTTRKCLGYGKLMTPNLADRYYGRGVDT